MPLKIKAKEFGYLNNINKYCPVCRQRIYEYDSDIEYSRTKRKTHIFIHTECVKKWSE